MVKKFPIETIEGRKILAVGAHPDDLEFSAGGTLALLSKRNKVTMVIATDGGEGTHDPNKDNGHLAMEREQEARKAAEILGVKEIVFFNYPDLELRNWRQNFFKKFLKFLVKNRPDIVISWDFWGRYEPLVHPDHRTVAEVVMEAILEGTLPNRLKKRGLLGVQPLNPKPKQWLMAPADPSHVVDVTKVWDTKWEALKVHTSQLPVKNPEQFHQVKSMLEEKWFKPQGMLVGVKFGEPFRILEM